MPRGFDCHGHHAVRNQSSLFVNSNRYEASALQFVKATVQSGPADTRNRVYAFCRDGSLTLARCYRAQDTFCREFQVFQGLSNAKIVKLLLRYDARSLAPQSVITVACPSEPSDSQLV